jgi:SET domain-containing protein
MHNYLILVEKLQSLYEGAAYEIGDSEIHGQGVMANRKMKHGDIIDKATDPSRKENGLPKVTPMGSKLNHSWDPNCMLNVVVTSRIIFHNLIAYKDIEPGDELTVDYSKYPEFKDPKPNWK